MIAAITASERLDTSPERIAERARRFSPATFRPRPAQVMEAALERKIEAPGRSATSRPTSLSSRLNPARSRAGDRQRGSRLHPGVRYSGSIELAGSLGAAAILPGRDGGTGPTDLGTNP
jgi:hypothetical protein